MNARVTEFMQRKGVISATVGVLSFAVGAGLGYILGKRRSDCVDSPEQLSLFVDEDGHYEANRFLFSNGEWPVKYLYGNSEDDAPVESADTDPVQPEYDPILEALLAEEAELVEKRLKAAKDDHPSVVRTIDLVAEVEAQLTVPDDDKEAEEDPPVVVHKVKFPHHGDVWDQEQEMSVRSSRLPYTLHQEEFFENELDFHQQTVTYYVGDDIMADQDDVPIYNWHGQMGDLNFGHGSTDADTVYIRNEMLKSEWEVIRDPGMFSIEVLGHQMEDAVEEEIKHSNRSVPKFRRE
jgi:hypothetical protein